MGGSRFLFSVLLACFAALGCASMILRDSDSAGTRAGKVLGRTLLGVSTLGISEVAISEAKAEEAEKKRLSDFYAFLDGSVGRMTQDEAVMRWGPPQSTYQGDRISISEWSSASTSSLIAPIGGMWVAVPVNRGWRLRLSFDAATNTLASWSYDEW